MRQWFRNEGALIPVVATAALFAVVGKRWLVILPDVALSAFAFAAVVRPDRRGLDGGRAAR